MSSYIFHLDIVYNIHISIEIYISFFLSSIVVSFTPISILVASDFVYSLFSVETDFLYTVTLIFIRRWRAWYCCNKGTIQFVFRIRFKKEYINSESLKADAKNIPTSVITCASPPVYFNETCVCVCVCLFAAGVEWVTAYQKFTFCVTNKSCK